MKILFIPAVCLTVLSGSAMAADLPSHKSIPGDVSSATSAWRGAYAGLNVGGTWGNFNSTNTSIWPTKSLDGYWTTSALLAGGLATGGASGFIGGGQVGYNWQLDASNISLLAGVEADIQGVASNKGSGQNPMSAVALSFTGHSQFATYSNAASNNYLSYIGTARGRIGFLATPTLLLYGTGGLAYGQTNLSLNQFQ